jgi:sulfoxide reductase heme-binding subunit YedZ
MPAAPKKMRAIDRVLKPLVFVACAAPLAVLAWKFWTNDLSANPLDDITDWTGRWTLRLLVATLAITPLRRLTGWNRLQKVRRMMGLWAFAYVSLHLTTYLWLDKFFAWGEILHDIAKRKFITVGFAGWTMLAALAATSTDGMVRRLGGKAWQRLHRLVYFAAAAGTVHFLWLVKADHRRPIAYGVTFAVLLALRLPPIADRLPRLRARLARKPATLNAPAADVMSAPDARPGEAPVSRDAQEA